MGYAGNMEPSYLIPSCIAKAVPRVSTLTFNKFYSKHGKLFRGIFNSLDQIYITDILTYTPFFYVFSKVESIGIWQTTPNSTFSSVMRPRRRAEHMSWAICLRVGRFRTGMVSKSSGTSQSTHICGATLKNIDLYSQSHLWTRPRTESKWLRLCSRHST